VLLLMLDTALLASAFSRASRRIYSDVGWSSLVACRAHNRRLNAQRLQLLAKVPLLRIRGSAL
jgi:hypothetical protein